MALFPLAGSAGYNFFLGSSLGSSLSCIFLLQEGGPVEGDDKQVIDFAEHHVRRISKDQRHADFECLDHLGSQLLSEYNL